MSGASDANRICLHSNADLEASLKRFWEIEEIPEQRPQTTEELKCEEHFMATHHRSSSGRYIVQLPFRQQINSLGESRKAAASRLSQMERRFKANRSLHKGYCEFMDEYERLGHMTEVHPGVAVEKSYYLPHHAVVKPDSSTTKLRVVFDASAASTSGVSLNDKLMVGARLQDDLYIILLRFRLHRIAFTADITKMYRQIEMAPAHRDFQRILWRKQMTDPVKEYQLNTVTYGTSAVPHLAVRSLQQLAIDEQTRFPIASAVLLNDFYVDDLISGCGSVESSITKVRSIIDILLRGGFDIRKWTSNCPQLLTTIPVDHQELRPDTELIPDSIKALGLHWNPAKDVIFFQSNLQRSISAATKRSLLSDISKLFDPIGLLAPIIIIGKILFQQLWLRGVDWDDPLPSDLAATWMDYRNSLCDVSQIEIERWLHTAGNSRVQLHAFADASERAYAAAIYIKSVDQTGNTIVSLVTAKTRVAPTKQLSLPRLELYAAHLASKLLVSVQRALKLHDAEIYAWSDSTITLAWINGVCGKSGCQNSTKY